MTQQLIPDGTWLGADENRGTTPLDDRIEPRKGVIFVIFVTSWFCP